MYIPLNISQCLFSIHGCNIESSALGNESTQLKKLAKQIVVILSHCIPLIWANCSKLSEKQMH